MAVWSNDRKFKTSSNFPHSFVDPYLASRIEFPVPG
jgi:hypothetical protein